jgi:hypothetical protein
MAMLSTTYKPIIGAILIALIFTPFITIICRSKIHRKKSKEEYYNSLTSYGDAMTRIAMALLQNTTLYVTSRVEPENKKPIIEIILGPAIDSKSDEVKKSNVDTVTPNGSRMKINKESDELNCSPLAL